MNSIATGNTAAGNQMQSYGSSSSYGTSGQLQPKDDLIQYAMNYARQNPGTAALWCFGVGFILGWKLKPW